MARVRPEVTRDAILDAAEKLITQHGYKRMTIAQLADKTGIGKGSVYLHFECKEDIALGHIDRMVERLKERLNAIADEPLPPCDRLKKMLCLRITFRFLTVQPYAQHLNELLGALREGLLERRPRYFLDEARIFSRVLDEGVAAGSFESDDTQATAFSFLEATNSLLPNNLSEGDFGDVDAIMRRVASISNLLIEGIRGKSAGCPDTAEEMVMDHRCQ